jgi:2-dehydro-3-deoxyphosphogluconate aldolase/(4S)-4-hydroxy-2-oxoglutarate aldolase
VVATVPAIKEAQVVEAADALVAGGVVCLQVPADEPGALDTIAYLAGRLVAQEVVVGACGVPDVAAAQAAIAAGADFIASPAFDERLVRYCIYHDVCVLAGARTLDEARRADRAGADAVRALASGPGAVEQVMEMLHALAPLRLVPAGDGVLDAAEQYSRAGALAVDVGRALTGAAVLHDLATDVERARAAVAAVERGRAARRAS